MYLSFWPSENAYQIPIFNHLNSCLKKLITGKLFNSFSKNHIVQNSENYQKSAGEKTTSSISTEFATNISTRPSRCTRMGVENF